MSGCAAPLLSRSHTKPMLVPPFTRRNCCRNIQIRKADLRQALAKYHASNDSEAYYLLTQSHVWNGFSWRLKLTVKAPDPDSPHSMNVHVGLCWSVDVSAGGRPLRLHSPSVCAGGWFQENRALLARHASPWVHDCSSKLWTMPIQTFLHVGGFRDAASAGPRAQHGGCAVQHRYLGLPERGRGASGCARLLLLCASSGPQACACAVQAGHRMKIMSRAALPAHLRYMQAALPRPAHHRRTPPIRIATS